MDMMQVHHAVSQCLFSLQHSLVLTAPTHRGMARLSWPGWLVNHQDNLPICRDHESPIHPASISFVHWNDLSSVAIQAQKWENCYSLHQLEKDSWKSTWVMKAAASAPRASATEVKATDKWRRQWPLDVWWRWWSVITERTFISSLFDFTFLTFIVLHRQQHFTSYST